MLNRRKFLASSIAVVVAPSVALDLESAPFGFARLSGYERYTGRDSVVVPPVPGSGPVQRITQFRGNIIAIRDDRAFISSVDGWKEILSDFSPTIEYIPPSFDQRALYHFDRPNGRCPNEMNCHFCLAQMVLV